MGMQAIQGSETEQGTTLRRLGESLTDGQPLHNIYKIMPLKNEVSI
jgi:hypothetical protein